MSKRSLTFYSFWILLSGLFNVGSAPEIPWKTFVRQLTTTQQEIEIKVAEPDFAGELDKLGILVEPQGRASGSPQALRHCKSLIYQAMLSLPSSATRYLKNLTLHFSTEGRRGLGGGSTIILRCPDRPEKDAETVSVFVHEIGHILDTGFFQGNPSSGLSEFQDFGEPIFEDDPSLQFYRLSFENEKKRKAGMSELDFVSGYAMSDPFEDFSESFNFYVLHGDEFRAIASTSRTLQAKYDFLRRQVFEGKEFTSGSSSYSEKVLLTQRYYDATILTFELDEFFGLRQNKRDLITQRF